MYRLKANYERKYEHRYKAYYEDGKDYNSPFYRAIRKYGWDSYKNGYNQTIGGHSLRGNNHPSFGHKLSEEHKEKLKASICRQVSQYSVSGEYIDCYDSAAQAGLSTDTDASGIIAVCKGKQQTAGEIW